jgi:ankyrin repeat protein
MSMGFRMSRSVGVCAILVLVTTALPVAKDPGLRLVTAAAQQDQATVRSLVKAGVNVNTPRADGATPLLFAAHWDDQEMVDLLIRAGANVNAADDHGVTPLARASENRNAGMVEKLLKAGANPNTSQLSGLTPLMIAAHTGNVELVKALLANGANVNAATTETGNTALMWAVADQHIDIVKVLIEGQANVHASSTKGFTPLIYAARNGNIDIAKLLIAAGVNVNEVGSDGTHVLPYSIVVGKGKFAEFLIAQGADPNGSMDGVRALHAAAGGVDIWLGDWYRRHGGGNIYGGFGFSLISAADRLPLVKLLLSKGADPNAGIDHSAMLMSYIGYPKKGAFEPFACGTGDLRGATPLWVAAYSANGDVGGFGGDGGPAAAMAAESSAEILKALLAGGADVKRTSNDGTTPPMVAAGLGRPTFIPGKPRATRSPGAEAAVQVLLDAGADINGVNEADFNALHGAAFRGLNEVIQILVDRGANINARDFRGRTAYRLAEGSKQSFQFQAWPETAEFIKKLGANTTLSIPGTVQERLRDVPAADQQQ